MATLTTDCLKLPPIPVPRGRSPGSSPDVRRRSKEREQQRKLRGSADNHHGFRLPRLFRGRSMSTAGYLAHSLTNLSEITGAESSDDGGLEWCPSSGQHSRKTSRNQQDYAKWPVVKTLSAASAKQHAQKHLYNSANSTPGDRLSPKSTSSPQTTPTALPTPENTTKQQRSQSHSHRFPFAFTFAFGGASSGGEETDGNCHFKNIHDAKGNWIGFAPRKNDGGPASSWNNKNTIFNRAKSADDILQLYVDDELS